MKNEKKILVPILFLIGGLVVFFPLALFGNIRNRRATVEHQVEVQRLETENRKVTGQLRRIQTAVDNFGTRLASDAAEAGDIAEGIGGVVTGLDESIEILGELLDFFAELEDLLARGGAGIP